MGLPLGWTELSGPPVPVKYKSRGKHPVLLVESLTGSQGLKVWETQSSGSVSIRSLLKSSPTLIVRILEVTGEPSRTA